MNNSDGDIFEGDWSRPLTLPAVCQSEYCSAVVLRQEIENLSIELFQLFARLIDWANIEHIPQTKIILDALLFT